MGASLAPIPTADFSTVSTRFPHWNPRAIHSEFCSESFLFIGNPRHSLYSTEFAIRDAENFMWNKWHVAYSARNPHWQIGRVVLIPKSTTNKENPGLKSTRMDREKSSIWTTPCGFTKCSPKLSGIAAHLLEWGWAQCLVLMQESAMDLLELQRVCGT